MNNTKLIEYLCSKMNASEKVENVSISKLEDAINSALERYQDKSLNFTELCSTLCNIRLRDSNGNGLDLYLNEVVDIKPVEIGRLIS